MYRIGLTGGVGSGKSTVSNYMHTLGIPVIDGDKLAREAVTPGSQAMARMEQVFGKEIFNEDGTLDRLKTAEIIFTNEEKRQQLNDIIHPYIWYRTQEELYRAQDEGSWQLRVEAVWIVEVPLEVQINRVIHRDHFTREQVLERIGKQMPTLNKLNYADVVIDNSHSVEETERQVREALKHVPGFVFPFACAFEHACALADS